MSFITAPVSAITNLTIAVAVNFEVVVLWS